jgi:hypothetical protein
MDDEMDHENDFHEQDDESADECPVCHGRETINPLTAPDGVFCIGTTECPLCDGLGRI